jgi:hypothetical protein
VDRLLGRRVRFLDGAEADVDLILYAPGYTIPFPFFEADFLRAEGNRLPRYLHVVPPTHPNLYFVGLIQPLGAVMPLAEVQCAWVADLLAGEAGLPARAVMEVAIRRDEAALARRYVASKRHTIQVDFYPYKRALERERKRGRKQPPNRALPAYEALQATVTEA